MSFGILIGAWLAGTLGGVHCLAMCGAFSAALAARECNGDGGKRLLPMRTLLRQQAGYQAGRVTTYAALGAIFGFGGATAMEATSLLPLQRAMYIVANVVLLALAASLVMERQHAGWLQRAGAQAFGAALPRLQPLLRRPGASGRIALGLVWGLVPCALVYSMLPLAMFAGGAWQGAAVMLAFGLGTVPNLAGAGLLAGRGQKLLARRGVRYAAAGLFVAYAAVGFYRVFFAADTLAMGPYCLMP